MSSRRSHTSLAIYGSISPFFRECSALFLSFLTVLHSPVAPSSPAALRVWRELNVFNPDDCTKGPRIGARFRRAFSLLADGRRGVGWSLLSATAGPPPKAHVRQAFLPWVVAWMRAAFPRTVTVRNDSYAGTPRFLPLPYCGGAVDMPPQMKAVMTDSNFRASTRLRILAGSFFPAARKACSRLARPQFSPK